MIDQNVSNAANKLKEDRENNIDYQNELKKKGEREKRKCVTCNEVKLLKEFNIRKDNYIYDTQCHNCMILEMRET